MVEEKKQTRTKTSYHPVFAFAIAGFFVFGLVALTVVSVMLRANVFRILGFIAAYIGILTFLIWGAERQSRSRLSRVVKGEVAKSEVQQETIKIVREEVVKDPELKKRLSQQDKQMKALSSEIEDLTSKLTHSQVNMILVLGVFAGLIAFVISGVSATRAMTPAGIGLTLTGLAICLGFVVILLSILFGGKQLLWLRILLLLIIIAGGVFWMHTTLNHPSNYATQVESSADTSSTQSSQ